MSSGVSSTRRERAGKVGAAFERSSALLRLELSLSDLDAPWPRRRGTSRKRLVWDDRLPPELVERLWREPDELLERGERLKDDVRTTVVRVAVPQPLPGSHSEADGAAVSRATRGPWALKRFNRKGLVHTAGHLLLPTRAWRGWHFGRLLRRHGVLTPAPLAYFEERLGPLRFRSFLLTEWVDGTLLHTLIQNWREVPESRWRQLAGQVVDLCAVLTRLRLLHGDLKATNFLVDSQWRLWVLDLDACRYARTSGAHWVGLQKDRSRFLRNFARCPWLAELFQTELNRLADRAAASGGGWTASTLWRTPEDEAVPGSGPLHWERLHDCPGASLLRRVHCRENWRLDLGHAGTERRVYYLKRHWGDGTSGRAAAPPGPFEAAVTLQLQRDHVPTMDVVGAGVVRSEGREESFLLTKELTGYVQLDHFLKERFGAEASWRTPQLAELIRCVAHVAKKFHDAGYNHRDLYCCHFFVRQTGDSFDVRLIDLQRVQRRDGRRRRWLVKDLAQLSYSAPRHCIGCKERVLFARHYFGVRRLGPEQKRLLRSVALKHALMEAKLGPHP